jgi:hypothetical protein
MGKFPVDAPKVRAKPVSIEAEFLDAYEQS